MSSLPPPEGSNVFLSDGTAWDQLRDSGIEPTLASDLDESWEKRSEFISGARMLGLGTKLMPTLKPQQLMTADVLNAARMRTVVLEPRRSSKTTSIFAWALGRCAERPDYMIAYTTCTTGQKARARYRNDIVKPLERMFPDEDSRPFRIYRAGGSERIEFDNGSQFQVLPPQGESFRSDAFDVVILDEAGEATPEMGDDLLEGILPTFDTRPDAQLVVAGTAAKYRTGNLLWDELEKARNGRAGALAFHAPDETTYDELEDWERVKVLALAAHPGIGTLTTLEVIQDRWENLKPAQFAAEYLGIFGTVGAKPGIMDTDRWTRGVIAGTKPQPPEKFALAIAAHPDQLSASIVAVWREDGYPRVLLLAHDRGIRWLSAEAARLSLKYQVPIIHDSTGTVMVEVEVMQRLRPRPVLKPQTFGNVQTAAGLIVKEVNTGKVGHWGQEKLNDAVAFAQKRAAGRGGGWALGRGNPEDDITPVEAAALALRAYDSAPEKRSMPQLVA